MATKAVIAALEKYAATDERAVVRNEVCFAQNAMVRAQAAERVKAAVAAEAAAMAAGLPPEAVEHAARYGHLSEYAARFGVSLDYVAPAPKGAAAQPKDEAVQLRAQIEALSAAVASLTANASATPAKAKAKAKGEAPAVEAAQP